MTYVPLTLLRAATGTAHPARRPNAKAFVTHVLTTLHAGTALPTALTGASGIGVDLYADHRRAADHMIPVRAEDAISAQHRKTVKMIRYTPRIRVVIGVLKEQCVVEWVHHWAPYRLHRADTAS